MARLFKKPGMISYPISAKFSFMDCDSCVVEIMFLMVILMDQGDKFDIWKVQNSYCKVCNQIDKTIPSLPVECWDFGRRSSYFSHNCDEILGQNHVAFRCYEQNSYFHKNVGTTLKSLDFWDNDIHIFVVMNHLGDFTNFWNATIWMIGQ